MRISDWSSDVCSSDRQDQNRQQQMQQDLRRSEDGLRLPDTPDSARLRGLQQRRADEAQQRQLDNQRRQIDARNRQLQNDRRPLATQQRLDRLPKIGRASRRERVCQYRWLPGVHVYLKIKSLSPYVTARPTEAPPDRTALTLSLAPH